LRVALNLISGTVTENDNIFPHLSLTPWPKWIFASAVVRPGLEGGMAYRLAWSVRKSGQRNPIASSVTDPVSA
jgi:hypothetical protein